MEELKKFIRNIPDFPKKGILFRDITPLLNNPTVFKKALEKLLEPFSSRKIDKVVAVEARGFILGGVISYLLNAGFVPVRKKGKLPYETLKVEYDLEYGKDVLEIHVDSIKKGEKVLIVDDLLATGGTAEATAQLVEKMGGEVVGIAFLIELTELKGKEKLKGYFVHSLIKY